MWVEEMEGMMMGNLILLLCIQWCLLFISHVHVHLLQHQCFYSCSATSAYIHKSFDARGCLDAARRRKCERRRRGIDWLLFAPNQLNSYLPNLKLKSVSGNCGR